MSDIDLTQDNSQTTLSGGGNSVQVAGTNESVLGVSSGDRIFLGTGASANVYGTYGTVNATNAGATVNLYTDTASGTAPEYDNVLVAASNVTVKDVSGASVLADSPLFKRNMVYVANDLTNITVSGNNEGIRIGNNVTVTINGSNETILAGTGDTIIVNGADDYVKAINSTVTFSGSGGTVGGAGDTVTHGSYDKEDMWHAVRDATINTKGYEWSSSSDTMTDLSGLAMPEFAAGNATTVDADYYAFKKGQQDTSHDRRRHHKHHHHKHHHKHHHDTQAATTSSTTSTEQTSPTFISSAADTGTQPVAATSALLTQASTATSTPALTSTASSSLALHALSQAAGLSASTLSGTSTLPTTATTYAATDITQASNHHAVTMVPTDSSTSALSSAVLNSQS